MEYSAASCGGLIEAGQCIGCRLAVDEVRHTPTAQSELFQGELTIILSNLESSMQKVKAELSTSVGGGSGVWPGLLAHVEAFLDTGDAVRRRKQANQINRDLAAERISHERAALELQALAKRQKGGWLQRSRGGVLNPLRAVKGLAEADPVVRRPDTDIAGR
jgi:hypothetical protein